MTYENSDSLDYHEALARQGRVMLAIVLRNIRTRFFGHGLGYLIALAWPLVHILILVAIFSALGRGAPVGDSPALFIATGVVPFLTFSYVSRFMMISILNAKPLFAFPQVKVLDVLIASGILEALSSCLNLIILFTIAWAFDIPAMPADRVQAAYAFGAAILLGIGFGILNGVIALAAPLWATGYALLNILMYVTSGIAFVPDSLPEPIRTAASYHPSLQAVEWMRSAYYEGYGGLVLDRGYLLCVCVVSIFLGLSLERGIRGAVLSSR